MSKTKDDATVTVPVRVQYFVLPDKVKEACYELDDPEDQIKAHVENVILSYIPKINLDDTYQQEDQIATRIKESLSAVMAKFGYSIENALVTKIVPADAVVKAMNDINAARREKVATEARAEANKIRLVRQAEAEAEAKALAGQGVARVCADLRRRRSGRGPARSDGAFDDDAIFRRAAGHWSAKQYDSVATFAGGGF